MDEFVASHSDAEVMENGKIRCTLTGHEVTPQLQTVTAPQLCSCASSGSTWQL